MGKEHSVLLLTKVDILIEKSADRYIREHDLTNSQFKVLIQLYRAIGKPTRQIDIEKELGLTNPTVTALLNALEEKDLVKRMVNLNDKRSKLVVLTDKAMAKRDSLYDLLDKFDSKLTVGLTSEEKEQFDTLLIKILENHQI